jgi:ATP-dependent Clp protease adaptor protein ClpS
MAHAKEQEGGVATEVVRKTQRAPLYKVILHNDDFTTQEFVVFILKTVFHLGESDAVIIMLHVHERGRGVAGLFPREVAEAKVERAIALARANEFPLLVTAEEE